MEVSKKKMSVSYIREKIDWYAIIEVEMKTAVVVFSTYLQCWQLFIEIITCINIVNDCRYFWIKHT